MLEVVGEGGIERENTDEKRKEGEDLELSICSQLTLSGSFNSYLLWYLSALPSHSASLNLSVKFIFHDPF